jgi:hypothetical protein
MESEEKLREIVTDQLFKRRLILRLKGERGEGLLIGRRNIHDFSEKSLVHLGDLGAPSFKPLILIWVRLDQVGTAQQEFYYVIVLQWMVKSLR